MYYIRVTEGGRSPTGVTLINNQKKGSQSSLVLTSKIYLIELNE
jgi:hypothetical protein